MSARPPLCMRPLLLQQPPAPHLSIPVSSLCSLRTVRQLLSTWSRLPAPPHNRSAAAEVGNVTSVPCFLSQGCNLSWPWPSSCRECLGYLAPFYNCWQLESESKTRLAESLDSVIAESKTFSSAPLNIWFLRPLYFLFVSLQDVEGTMFLVCRVAHP